MSNKIKKIYHAAIYVRLSKEDGDVSSAAKAESNSITVASDIASFFFIVLPPIYFDVCCVGYSPIKLAHFSVFQLSRRESARASCISVRTFLPFSRTICRSSSFCQHRDGSARIVRMILTGKSNSWHRETSWTFFMSSSLYSQ